MAGVKGRSGGARPGTGGAMPNSGGLRSGSGRKKKSASNEEKKSPLADKSELDMLEFLQQVALGVVEASATQVRAAIAAVQYTHTKLADGGKKEAQAEKAKKVAGGKFAASAPPRLVVNNGGR